MVLKVYLKVKFRAFGVDLYKFEKSWVEPIPFPISVPEHTFVDFNDRGVNLAVKLLKSA